jgi:hypothetical protein
MFPGTYACHAVLRLLTVMEVRGSVTLQGTTISLVVTTVLLMIVITVGLAIPPLKVVNLANQPFTVTGLTIRRQSP